MNTAQTIAAALLLVAAAPSQDEGVFTVRALAADGFDLDAEGERLQRWLATSGARDGITREPLRINLFNWLRAEQGGPLSPSLAWFPRRIRPAAGNRWEYSLAMGGSEDHVVALFTDAEWNDGQRALGAPEFLLELVPIDMRQPYFDQSDVDRNSIQVIQDEIGLPSIGYRIKAARQDAFADWTGSMIGRKAAISVNGIVLTAPTFRVRIRSGGQISGSFTEEEAEELVQALRASAGAGDEQAIAAGALIRATPDDPSIAMAYAYRLLHGPEEQARLDAAAALGGFGEPAAPAVPDLIQALADDSSRVRAEVINALGLIGPAARAAIPRLEALSSDEDEQIAQRARAALREIRREPRQVP